MIDLLEKFVWVLTVGAIGFVGFCYLYHPNPSISQEYILKEAQELQRLQGGMRSGAGGPQAEPVGPMAAPKRGSPAASTPRPSSERPAAREKSRVPKEMERTPGRIAEIFPKGVDPPPTPVPRSFKEKYASSLQETVNLLKTAAGSFVTLPDGSTGFGLTSIDEGSLLGSVVGVRSGDCIISVNGHAVEGVSQARQLYDTLKNESTFYVVCIRGGQRITLVYNVH